jgi:DNA-binding beta-propeller fold protein YncE
MSRILFTSVVAGCFVLANLPAQAQQVVHALTGTVSSIDTTEKTITLFLDGGSESTFNDMTNSKTPITVDKRILAETTAVDDFKKKGAYVIVFYFGGDTRSVVALRNLGAGPFTSTVGTVIKLDGREHSIAVQDDSGAIQTFRLSAETVAESGFGAVNGLKFQVQRGDHVRVVGANLNGAAEALFVSAN